MQSSATVTQTVTSMLKHIIEFTHFRYSQQKQNVINSVKVEFVVEMFCSIALDCTGVPNREVTECMCICIHMCVCVCVCVCSYCRATCITFCIENQINHVNLVFFIYHTSYNNFIIIFNCNYNCHFILYHFVS